MAKLTIDDLKKINDSIAIESFKFYKKRNKKELAYNVTIEILTDKRRTEIKN